MPISVCSLTGAIKTRYILIMIGTWTKNWAKHAGLTCFYYPEMTSTNTHAKELKSNGSPFLIVTDHQTNGRGRSQNTWTNTEAGSCLLSSWSVDLNHPPQPIASALVGLTLFESVVGTWPQLPWSLKAPNDLYLEKSKVGGLLLETVSQADRHRFIVGLGMNIKNAPDIPSAGFVEHFLKSCITEQDWDSFLAKWWDGLQSVLYRVSRPLLDEEHRRRLLLALNQSPLLTEKFVDVLPDGSLKTRLGVQPWFNI